MVYCVVERYYKSDMEITMMKDVELNKYLTTVLINDLSVDKSEVIGLNLSDKISYLEDELNETYEDSDVSISGIIIVDEKNRTLIDWYRG